MFMYGIDLLLFLGFETYIALYSKTKQLIANWAYVSYFALLLLFCVIIIYQSQIAGY